jgi:hypothetical protein
MQCAKDEAGMRREREEREKKRTDWNQKANIWAKQRPRKAHH